MSAENALYLELVPLLLAVGCLMTTGEAIVQSLVRHGVDTVFGIPGAHTYAFIDALHECRDRIRFVVTRHEQGAGYMAYGYAESTGRPGAFLVVPGPGLLNTCIRAATGATISSPIARSAAAAFRCSIRRP